MATKEEIDSRLGILSQGLINNLYGGLSAVIPGLVKAWGDTAQATWISSDIAAWAKTVDMWIETGVVSSDLGPPLKKFSEATGILGGIMRFLVRLQVTTGYIKSSTDIAALDRQYDLLGKVTPNPAPAEALVASMMIDPKRATENRAQLKRLGYDDTQVDNIILAHYRRVEEDTIRTLYLRGHYDVAKMYERMRELGYTDTRTAEIVKTWQLYPSPQDLFTMVAHEAFEPDIYTKIGLDAEFPSEQIPWLEAQGISKEWAMKYWISHWNQPSLEMGFDMLHRGVINRDELDMLFRIVEIPQFWREKLMAITYNPYTRVDVRRMHELGVVTTQELVQAYQDLGYDATKAVKMAEFTIRYNAEGDNKLTRSAIQAAYHDDLISRTDALELMQSQNLSADAADYYLTLEDYKITQESIKINIDTVKERFLLGVDNETVTRSSLNKLGLRGSKIDALISNMSTDLYKYQALPSKAELNNMLINKVITEGQWRSVMTRQGYTFEHQNWYLALMKRELTVSQAQPSRSDLQSWYKKELISEQVFRAEMAALGYNEAYTTLYLKSM